MRKKQKSNNSRKAIMTLHSSTERAGNIRNILLVSTFLLSSVSFSWSQQTQSIGHAMPILMDSPFSALNGSLGKTADAILDSIAVLDSMKKTGSAPEDSSPSSATAAMSVIQYDAQTHSIPGTMMRAAARLNSLRPIIDPILRHAGVPTEFAAVVLIESGGDPMALSPKGARGLWQLMPTTARRYGLTVDNSEDDRLDIEKSTRAAAHYLSDLYSEFGSWPLALAAYNTGEQNVQSAIERSRSMDFIVLSSLRLLPVETRNYVPAVFAAIAKGAAAR